MENVETNFYCEVEDSFDKTLHNCLLLIDDCSTILNKYSHLCNGGGNVMTSMEIEYSSFMIKYLTVLLRSLESKTCIKKDVLKLNDYMLYEFKRLRYKYEIENQFNYFSINDESLFMRNTKLFLCTEEFIETKLGLIYLRYLHYYLDKLKKNLSIYDRNNFVFESKRHLFKYSYIVVLL